MDLMYCDRNRVYCDSASVFSRQQFDDWKTSQNTNNFKDWITHEDEAYAIGNSRRGNYVLEVDGKGRDKRRDISPRFDHRRDEMVGPKPVLKLVMSQPPQGTRRRDEMVTSGRRVYSERRDDGYHHSRQRKHSDEKQNRRRRSVSPQMSSKSHHTKHSETSQVQHSNNRKSSNELQQSSSTSSGVKMKQEDNKMNMSDHDNRCKTYEYEPKWPHTRIHHVSLASHGMYYTGVEDIVECFDCKVLIYDWSVRDDPLRRHFYAYPNCEFLRREYHADIEEVCTEDMKEFSSYESRCDTFLNWPIPRQIDGRDLAMCGWFYLGRDIKTQCFTCGCVYDQWKKGDDPVIKHKELSSKCSYIQELDCKSSKSGASYNNIDFSSLQSRIESFKLLDKDFPVTKKQFAEAGFYLLGTHPVIVKCCSCDLVVNWLKCNQDPFEYHRNNSPQCSYIVEKGQHSKCNEEKQDYYGQRVMKSSNGLLPNSNGPVPCKVEHMHDICSLPVNVHHAQPTSSNYHQKYTSYDTHFYASLPTTTVHNTATTVDEVFPEGKLCVVCLDNVKEYAIVPCGHLCVCRGCVNKLTHCPICREVKQNILRIYNS